MVDKSSCIAAIVCLLCCPLQTIHSNSRQGTVPEEVNLHPVVHNVQGQVIVPIPQEAQPWWSSFKTKQWNMCWMMAVIATCSFLNLIRAPIRLFLRSGQ